MKAKLFPVLGFVASFAFATAQPANASCGSLQVTDRSIEQHQRHEGVESGAVQAEANLRILAFAKTKPTAIFEMVRYTMADVIEAKAASSLEQAYVIAVYLHYSVTTDNYRQLGISDAEYRWLASSKNDLPVSGESSVPGRI